MSDFPTSIDFIRVFKGQKKCPSNVITEIQAIKNPPERVGQL